MQKNMQEYHAIVVVHLAQHLEPLLELFILLTK